MNFKIALFKSKNGKAPGYDKISSNLYKHATERLLRLANGKILEDFRKAIVVPVYKKGDRKDHNFRGVSLLATSYKILVKMMSRRIEARLEPTRQESQNVFRKGRSCIDGGYTVKMVMEKRREFSPKTHFCFTDLAKTYDKRKTGETLQHRTQTGNGRSLTKSH